MSNDHDDEENADEDNIDTPSAPTSSSTTKEKRSWFHSLTRRKKSEPTLTASSTSSSVVAQSQNQHIPQNNNNESDVQTATVSVDDAIVSRKRKEKKNVFQHIRKKMGLRFQSLRHRRSLSDGQSSGSATGGASGTTDASAEFLTHSRLTFKFTNRARNDDPEIPFTHDYKRFITKKWLQHEDGPNHVMHKACSEMLSQVWYWGEISRRDAQKRLTDKPTGSFLVRDSETTGLHFTLSFRIVNVTLHYRLVHRDDFWRFEELAYESIVEMINDILHRCTNDNFVCFVKVPNEMQPPFPVILKYPLSRYLSMPQLQDLCRRVIQRQMEEEEIQKLPVPVKLLDYLSERRELVFQS